MSEGKEFKRKSSGVIGCGLRGAVYIFLLFIRHCDRLRLQAFFKRSSESIGENGMNKLVMISN